MERAPKTYNVRAVERAMLILSAFDDEHADRGVSEIAQATAQHKATAHRSIYSNITPVMRHVHLRLDMHP